jgi:predicted phage baseplate assembly protein
MTCEDERRRAHVRKSEWNGIDGVNVSADQCGLTVLLFGNAPRDIGPDNFRIDGGRTVTGIEVVSVRPCETEDTELHDCLVLTVDRPGDWSTYRLCVVEADPRGGPGTKPYPGFDPRYACVDFSFKQQCPSDLDCKPVADCPPERHPAPVIDYLAKDYASLRQVLYERLALTMPEWNERHVPDLGVALVELLAYAGDQLSYYQDAVAAEAYLNTARLRTSVRRHVRLLDYPMHDGCAARAWVCLEISEPITLPARDFRFVNLGPGWVNTRGPALLQEELDRLSVPPDGYEVFEPVHGEAVSLRPEHNAISLWTWGNHDCCLPKGATSATLRDAWAADGKHRDKPKRRALQLAPGDVLVFEEVRGPATGAEADADPTHRQAVRLTSVTPAVDEPYDQPILQVTWDRDDALEFALCVNARGGPECEDLEVGLARGNVVLVEHGRSLTWCGAKPEEIGVPPADPDEQGCPEPVAMVGVPGTAENGHSGCPDPGGAGWLPSYPPIYQPFRPALRYAPVTQTAPYPDPAEVARGQAERLRGVPDRAEEAVKALLRKAKRNTDLAEADVEYLTVLFGASTLRRYELAGHPRRALRRLLAEFDDLLATKLDRLAELVRRARAGYVLDPGDEGWELAQSWGRAEAEAIDPSRPAFRGPAGQAQRIDPARGLPAVAVQHESETWLPRRDLIRSGPRDRHFVGETDDDGKLRLRFGPTAPPAGATLAVHYRVGNGEAGNLGREAINKIVFCGTRQSSSGPRQASPADGPPPPQGITKVRNPLPAVGGTEPEPVADVRRRAPEHMLHRLERAITATDYATLAEDRTGPEVQRAAGDLRWTGSWYEAQVGIDALGTTVSYRPPAGYARPGPTPTAAPQWLLDEVRQALHRYRRIGHDLAVSTARLVPLDLELKVTVDPDYIQGHVKEAVQLALSSEPGGLFHPDNLTFGTPVRVSQIVATAAAVAGVRHVEATRLRRLFDAGDPTEAVDSGVLPLRRLEVAQLDSDRLLENGRLELVMEGGR